MNWLSKILGIMGVMALSYAFAKEPTALDKAVSSTFKESRKLQKSYHERVFAEKKVVKSGKRKVIDDVPVELGSDVPDLDYQPSTDTAADGN